MFKLLIFAGLLYALYYLVFNRPQIGSGQDQSNIHHSSKETKKNEDGEYVDYEEVD